VNPNPDRDTTKNADRDPPGSPYGPQPRGTDEAAGGADSSPHETEPSGERKANDDRDRRAGRSNGAAGEANQTS